MSWICALDGACGLVAAAYVMGSCLPSPGPVFFTGVLLVLQCFVLAAFDGGEAVLLIIFIVIVIITVILDDFHIHVSRICCFVLG